MQIAIIDHENARVLISEVPTYLTDKNAEPDEVASAIMEALGINSGNTEYMIGHFQTQIHKNVIIDTIKDINDLTGDFKEDALLALENICD